MVVLHVTCHFVEIVVAGVSEGSIARSGGASAFTIIRVSHEELAGIIRAARFVAFGEGETESVLAASARGALLVLTNLPVAKAAVDRNFGMGTLVVPAIL